MFVIDVGYHKIAVTEAKKLGIPIVARRRHQPLAGRHRLRDSRATTTRAARSACTRAASPTRCSRAAAQVDPGDRPGRRRVRRGVRGSGAAHDGAPVAHGGARRGTPPRLAPNARPRRPRRPARCPATPGHQQRNTEHTKMAEISASMVMELRQRTGLGMMECKKALTETGGDLVEGRGAAAHQERRQGVARPRAASRPKASSARSLAPTRKTGAMVEVNCETDFVARNDDFNAFAKRARAARRRAESGRRRRALRAAARRRHGRGAPRRRWCRRSARTCRSAASCASRPPRPARAVRARRRPHRRDRRRSTAATRRSARTSRCTSRRPARRAPCARSACRATRCRRELIAKERAISTRAGRRIRQAGGHRREDGRGPRRQVPGRGDAARRSRSSRTRTRRSRSYLKAQGRDGQGFALFVVGEGIEKKKDDFAAEVAAMAKA